ncbi:prepilin-type N-terminal cleavage/methylation domain-containing protein [Desulfonatronum sp. SC1]|uniref:prepilin-type N-terminal cleavage/methylation domain-containing protein n=1 Tax=Desulfonatronum sp. SC1 TaxID=2109626 RepID=UPI000D2FE8CE|nr:prepilin-type N-terminal cleavage/methylation domain-containing protein [Desulfonatronum sp. SC1]PTN31935.1 prepilin-type cleavage/methylation domain-containing protein [Desulfonatronum sp. SC1]
MLQSKHSQSGFTLVEIAIVLVIIGLLLGGILKGQEMITNSRVKNAINNIQGVTAAVYAYNDRYSALPGDDRNAAPARGTAWSSTTPGNGNGIIGTATGNPFTTTGENLTFWQHLRAAGFITGDPSEAFRPQNAFGGLMGVATLTTRLNNMNSRSLCLSQVPGQAAVNIDNQLDDGRPDSGSVRSTLGAAGANTNPGAAATAYNEDNVYTVCIAF